MRIFLLLTTALGMLSAVLANAGQDKADLTGTWKLDQARSDSGQADKGLVLFIEEKDQTIHIKESGGSIAKEEASDFTCDTMGKPCEIQDGKDKASVTVYYNGPALVVITSGRKGNSVEKHRLSLSPDGSLTMEVTHIVPQGKTEKLVFVKAM
jgi:hypothetical protein